MTLDPLALVETLFADLRDRRLLKWLFSEEETIVMHDSYGEAVHSIDLDVQEEIKIAWRKIVADALASAGAGDGWPKVKPLEWEEAEGSYTAQSALGEVYIDQDGDGFYAIENGRKHSEFATVEAAQAFVQANHNRWVGDWLVPAAPLNEEVKR